MKTREGGKTALIIILALMAAGLIWYAVASTPPFSTPASTPPIGEIEYSNILLYFHNPSKDPRADICSRDAVFPVVRRVPKTQTPVQDAVQLLLKGELTAEERMAGFSTEFPLKGLELAGANLKDGVLTLEFRNPENRTGGGSCRVGILWSQIEKTAMQFSGVKQVRFIPEELFQP